jgi:glucuronate isomerase
MSTAIPLDRNLRYLGPGARQAEVAYALYEPVCRLPLICPHGHVEPRVFGDPDYSFGSPAELLIIPDHYVVRMLYSQGVAMEDLGIPRKDGGPVEQDHRAIWRRFAERFHLFRGTPTGIWINDELRDIFGIDTPLSAASADAIYDSTEAQLRKPEFRPRALYERFNIEVLCTTDAATDSLDNHQAVRASGWRGDVRPTFRPDVLLNLDTPDWRSQIDLLSASSAISVRGYGDFVRALEARRAVFKQLGATATDHAALTPFTAPLSESQAEAIFQRALRGQNEADDARLFSGHMLMEMARMSIDDGLVMQLHAGSLRNHHAHIAARFGPNSGADIPIASDFTRNLQPLLNAYGRDPRLTLVLFTLDETVYSRELAPLAGHYPALRLGPPWWFFDSLNGMSRFFDAVVETAGIHNTAGFNDDTRAFCSIPARHDVWRRASANWLAGLVLRQIVSMSEAHEMSHAMAYGLARETYRFGQ